MARPLRILSDLWAVNASNVRLHLMSLKKNYLQLIIMFLIVFHGMIRCGQVIDIQWQQTDNIDKHTHTPNQPTNEDHRFIEGLVDIGL